MVTISMYFNEWCQTKSAVCLPGEGVHWYVHRLRLFWGVKNFEFQYFWGFSENWIFFGVWRFCWYFFGDSPKLDNIYRYFYAFLGIFWKSRYRMEDIFWAAKISKIYFGCLKFLIFFVNGRCWAQAYVWRKMRESPLLGIVHQFKHVSVKCI